MAAELVILVTPETLRTEASTLNTLKENHRTQMNDLRRLVYALHEQWTGAAQDAFLSKFQQLQTEFDEFVVLLEDHIRHMETEAQQMEEKDADLSRRIGNYSMNIRK